MSELFRNCPECDSEQVAYSRRAFLKTAGAAAAVAATALDGSSRALASAVEQDVPETVVKLLYDALSAEQKKEVCFDWDYVDDRRGLLRTRISNNWHITKPAINSEFYTAEQRQMIRDIFEGLIQPEWHAKIDKQLQDDAGGFGKSQNIAIFGQPGSGKFEFVMTGRHMTLRCDGNSADHVAFGGPIFYGHAASGFDEKPGHPGNVFWHQALAANEVFEVLDGRQRRQALVKQAPVEKKVAFQGTKGELSGIPIADLSTDQKEHVQKVLQLLLAPYRKSDQDEALACLKVQGGLDKCHLSFYQNDADGKDADLGSDKVWDIWRLEGPSFVWFFRGVPHVHTWINVAESASVNLNA